MGFWRELFLEVVVGAALVALGVAVFWGFGVDPRDADLTLAYLLGALAVSVPAIVIVERRRRRRRQP